MSIPQMFTYGTAVIYCGKRIHHTLPGKTNKTQKTEAQIALIYNFISVMML